MDIKEGFEELLNIHADSFAEACLGICTDDVIGNVLVELDERLFKGSFKAELLEESEDFEDFYRTENDWFERGR